MLATRCVAVFYQIRGAGRNFAVGSSCVVNLN